MTLDELVLKLQTVGLTSRLSPEQFTQEVDRYVLQNRDCLGLTTAGEINNGSVTMEVYSGEESDEVTLNPVNDNGERQPIHLTKPDGSNGRMALADLRVVPNQPKNGAGLPCMVHKSVYSNLLQMIDAFEAEFGNGSFKIVSAYRSFEHQVRLQNPELYSQGKKTPFVAWPGRSNHGWGLAIDVQIDPGGVRNKAGNNSILQTKPYFKWLQQNAASYGFYNYPREAWHWSTNGR